MTGLVCHRRLRTTVASAPGWADTTSANLTPASGRQDHTTSPYAATSLVRVPLIAHKSRRPALQPRRTQDAAASTAFHPAFVTIMIRPSCGMGWRKLVEMICPTGEAKYFCEQDWTAQIKLKNHNKSPCMRDRHERRHAGELIPSRRPCESRGLIRRVVSVRRRCAFARTTPSGLRSTMDPGSAAHHAASHSASKTRVNALLGCAASRERTRGT